MDPLDEVLFPATALLLVGAAAVHVAAGTGMESSFALGVDAFTWMGVAYLGIGGLVAAVYLRTRVEASGHDG